MRARRIGCGPLRIGSVPGGDRPLPGVQLNVRGVLRSADQDGVVELGERCRDLDAVAVGDRT